MTQTNINKNVVGLESQTAIKPDNIDTKKDAKDNKDNKDNKPKPLSDALKSVLNSKTYFSDIMAYMCDHKTTTIKKMVTIIDNNKKSHAYKHSLAYRGYGQNPITAIKIFNRLTGGFKHYSHLIKTDVTKKIDIKNSKNKTITDTSDINDSCYLVKFKPTA